MDVFGICFSGIGVVLPANLVSQDSGLWQGLLGFIMGIIRWGDTAGYSCRFWSQRKFKTRRQLGEGRLDKEKRKMKALREVPDVGNRSVQVNLYP